MLSIRPNVKSLAFHLFARALHPELFQVFCSKRIDQSRFSAKIDITHDGHVVTFSSDSVTLTEVACSGSQMLPQRRRLLNEHLRNKTQESVEGPCGVIYKTEFEMEHVGPDLFAIVQSELVGRQKELELLHVFDSSGRLSVGAVSYIHVETRPRSLTVQALHTFPDEHAIVKTFSTFSVPKAKA